MPESMETYILRRLLVFTKFNPCISQPLTFIEADKEVHEKQRHTAKKIWEILQSEGFEGGYTIVKDAQFHKLLQVNDL